MRNIYVWDLSTRLFHWLLVLAIAIQYLTAEILDDAIQWHFYGGYFILGLLIFRLFWGVWGAYYARFSQFVVSPKRSAQYLANFNSEHYKQSLGHNPMGAYSVLFILAVLITQAISGLFISDDIFHDGPYYNAVSEETQNVMNWLHHQLFNAVWLFLILHLSAIIIYKLAKQQNLVSSMITGYKKQQSNSEMPTAKNHLIKMILFIALSMLVVYLSVVTFAPDIVDDFYY